jgi:hypothetical protein
LLFFMVNKVNYLDNIKKYPLVSDKTF